MPDSNVVTTSETEVGTTLISDHATMLWQRPQGCCDNAVTISLCPLGSNKGIVSKLVEKMGGKHPAGQSFWNAHKDPVWLHLTFILLFYLV